MHIPDGFLNIPATVTTAGIAAGTLGFSVYKVNRKLQPEQIPLVGILATFVFVAQLFSFPVIGGTSVHITGAVLVSILLGPTTGFIIITASLFLLALLFQHGGFLSLGANMVNMGAVGCFFGYAIYHLLERSRTLAIFAATIISSLAAASLCALELAWSELFPLSSGLTAMLSAYGIAGIIEGFITLSILTFILRVKPSLLENVVR